MAKCKICQSKLREDIDKQIRSGSNFNYLAKWCKDRDFKVTPQTLKRHAINHLADYSLPEKPNKETIELVQEQTNINLNIISFEAYCNAIGLESKDFKNLDYNLEKIIYGSQKALSLLFFKNSAVVDFKLTQHINSQSAYPSQQIKGLRLIFEMYAKITGIELMINENTAIKLLESLGYTISKS